MSLKVGYLQRYLIIIEQIRRKKYIGIDELVDAVRGKIASYVEPDMVGLSKRSIQRDIKDISLDTRIRLIGVIFTDFLFF